jgi:hypothetical protein
VLDSTCALLHIGSPAVPTWIQSNTSNRRNRRQFWLECETEGVPKLPEAIESVGLNVHQKTQLPITSKSKNHSCSYFQRLASFSILHSRLCARLFLVAFAEQFLGFSVVAGFRTELLGEDAGSEFLLTISRRAIFFDQLHGEKYKCLR